MLCLKVETTAKWAEQTPAGFVFDIKLPKLLSWHCTEYKSLAPEIRHLAAARTANAVERTPRLVDALVRHPGERPCAAAQGRQTRSTPPAAVAGVLTTQTCGA